VLWIMQVVVVVVLVDMERSARWDKRFVIVVSDAMLYEMKNWSNIEYRDGKALGLSENVSQQ
jgi:hypothetical protein